MTENAKIQLGLAAISLLGVVFQGVMAYLMAKLKTSQEKSAKEATADREDIRQTLETNTEAGGRKMDHLTATLQVNSKKLDDQTALGKSTHTLVNSQMEAQLKLVALYARQVADLTHAPESIKAAEEAESILQGHQDRQRKADDRTATDAADKGIPGS